MKIVKELSNSIENLDTLIKLSKEGKRIGVKYSEDILVSTPGFLFKVSSNETSEFGLADGEEKNVILNEGYYFDNSGDLYVKEGTMVIYEKIFDDNSGVIGDVVIGSIDGSSCYTQCLVAEDECSNALIGTNVYIVE